MTGFFILGLGLSTLCGCATLPKNFEAPASQAIPQGEPTALGNLYRPELTAHLCQSGFFVLNLGREAFLARTVLAEAAEKTIDCQYYIWNGDASGVILMQRLLHAADRGVRVRLLLDDMTTHGKDLGLAALDGHPNIEIRLFNPLGRRYYFGLFRMLSLTLHAGRMTNRMHNKIFSVDNQVAIVGGRNIGDEYFGVNKRSNFRDLDLMAVGPIVNEVSRAFDDYWNSPWSVPFQVFKPQQPSEKKIMRKMEKLEKNFKKMESEFPYPLDWSRENTLRILSDHKARFLWSQASLVCDPPGKAWKKAERGTRTSHIANTLENLIRDARSDILVVSPYFILSPKNVEGMGVKVQQDVAMRVLTNSLSSTDAVPVVAMYRKIRKPLLRQGVQIYEMRPDAASRQTQADASVSKARLSLHAKTVVFDRKKVFVGTFNVDPRSEYLNTEIGLLVESPPLAEQILGYLEQDTNPKNSYTVHLTDDGKSIRWLYEEAGQQKQVSSDPLAGFWLRFKAGFLSLLPISQQL